MIISWIYAERQGVGVISVALGRGDLGVVGVWRWGIGTMSCLLPLVVRMSVGGGVGCCFAAEAEAEQELLAYRHVVDAEVCGTLSTERSSAVWRAHAVLYRAWRRPAGIGGRGWYFGGIGSGACAGSEHTD